MPDGEESRPSGLVGKLKRWGVRLLVAAALSILFGAVVVGVILLYFNSGLPPIDRLSEYRPPQVTRMVDSRGVVVAELFEERRTVVPFGSIPVHVRNAFLAAEDADFYKHKGLDFPGLLRAFWANLKAGRVVQGGSTITQQVIKTFILGPERSYSRKIRELLLAFRLESNLTKDEILYLYMNQIYFGHGSYGVQEASRFYFGKDVSELSLAEGATLASLPKSPGRYSPVRHPERARKRRSWVLDQMLRNKMLPADQIETAKEAELVTAGRSVDFFELAPYYAEHCRRVLEKRLGRDRLYRGGLRVEMALDLNLQRHARSSVQDGLRAIDRRQGYRGPLGRISSERLDQIRQQLRPDLRAGRIWSLVKREQDSDDGAGPEAAWKARTLEPVEGLRVIVPVVAVDGEGKRAIARVDLGASRAPLDLERVKWARRFSPVKRTRTPKSVAEVVSVGDVLEVELDAVGPDRLSVRLGQPPLVQGALVAIDPVSRRVLAMVGGSDFRRTSLIRAVQSRRQPGSAFKPIVYAAAVQAGAVTPATILMDTPEVYRSSLRGKAWKPLNYERVFVGPVSVRHALAHSINTVAVKVAADLGPAAVIRMAHSLGIESDLRRNLSIALGSSEVTPLELTNAYTTFAAGGKVAEPQFIVRVAGPDGEEIELPEHRESQAIDPAVAYVITSLLRSAVEDGTGKKARSLGRPVAGKTGTANQQRDGWFVGFSPGLVCGVWVGFDDHSRMGKGWAAGSGTALPIWIQFMEEALEGKPRMNFPAPPEVVFARVDPENGLLAPPRMAGARFEVFLAGSEPRAVSSRVVSGFDEGSGLRPRTDVSEPSSSPGRLPDGMFR